MYEIPDEYRAIVKREILALERETHCHVVDGENAFCPRCGEFGTWNIEGKGFVGAYGNSIYYSTVFNQWRCRICDIRRCH